MTSPATVLLLGFFKVQEPRSNGLPSKHICPQFIHSYMHQLGDSNIGDGTALYRSFGKAGQPPHIFAYVCKINLCFYANCSGLFKTAERMFGVRGSMCLFQGGKNMVTALVQCIPSLFPCRSDFNQLFGTKLPTGHLFPTVPCDKGLGWSGDQLNRFSH